MAKVAIVTDSTAYLEPGVAHELGITVVPLGIHIGDETLRDGIDITPEAFFQRLERGGPLPRTTSPTMQSFERVYADLHTRTDQILSIHLSGQLSQTVHQAQRGAESLLGRCEIAVIDSMTTSLGLGILATAAAKAARDGTNLDEIVRLIRGMIPHIYIVFYVNEMSYLERGRRIGRAQAILGSMLNIKPLLFMEDGEIIPLEKVRTHEKAIEKLFEFVAEFSDLEQAAIVQRSATPTKETKLLMERLEQLFPAVKFPVIQYGPVLASHVGPSAMGVVVYETPGW
jgi:fatty acid kinase fatty acid binding subunit